MLYRSILRDIAADALRRAQTIAADRVYTPRDWPTTACYPCILVDCLSDRKESLGQEPPAFTATATLDVEARIQETSVAAARDACETLCDQIECALLTCTDLLRRIQHVSSIESAMELNATGRMHIADMRMSFALEYFIAFDPFTDTPVALQPVAVPLEEIGIHADTIEPADKSGTYPNPPFPEAITPEPRTRGPDGRDEGTLVIKPQDLERE
ncbi:hypothetical protein [Caballeronia sp. BR00000012568055]|uniref:hypothetical protein n=1 Tax=Caballeronia sp. BR00000012568055 TaxID=2918761 RepID=UPI0023F7F249|nr:hypothetical protein [Caballeronia sp. BR00000012568055]